VSVQSSEERADIQYQLYPIELIRISRRTVRVNHGDVETVYIRFGSGGGMDYRYISFLIFVSCLQHNMIPSS